MDGEFAERVFQKGTDIHKEIHGIMPGRCGAQSGGERNVEKERGEVRGI